jgi:hypothetical protein
MNYLNALFHLVLPTLKQRGSALPNDGLMNPISIKCLPQESAEYCLVSLFFPAFSNLLSLILLPIYPFPMADVK